MIENLKQDWCRLTGGYSTDTVLIEALWQEIISHYSATGRFYHNLDHVAALLKWADRFADAIREPDVLRFSVFYHDIIYDVTRRDNENRSAALAGERLRELGVPGERITWCIRQIEATQSHCPDYSMEPGMETIDLDLFLDFDLAILGAPWEVYLEYTRNIRREYHIYPDDKYREGRKKVLNHFLAAPAIYRTDFFRTHREIIARENMVRELS